MKPLSCDKQSMKRGLWSEDEDAKILEYVSKHGTGKWNSIPKKAGLRRCGKSCRLRWTNYLRPDLKHENFTTKEEELIIKLHAAIGSRWSMIAQQLPGRTDNDIKNYWNTKLKKKLVDMGIDPVTHKPFSQIFADYGSLGGPSKPGMRIGSFNKDLKNAVFIKTDTPSNNIVLPNNINNNTPFAMPIMTTMPMPSPTLVVPPKTEPIQDNNNSLDLLVELQAINLVKEASNYNNIITTNHESSSSSSSFPNNFLIDQGTFSSSSSSSSSSTCSSAAKDFSPIGFNWNEFLLEDEFLPNEDQECQEKESHLNNNDDTSNKLEVPNNKDVGCDTISSNDVNENQTSFVEVLIAKESEMLMEFRDLMGQEFY